MSTPPRRPPRASRLVLPAFALAAMAIVLGLARPWAERSPIALFTLFDPDVRVENHRAMERIMPARPVRAPEEPFRFSRAERPLEVTYEFEGERRTLEGFLERASATGLLVVKDDAIVTERYFQGGHEGARFTSWSMAKSFVATLVGMTLGDGKIESLDDPISRYAPELEESAWAGVPIRHVLQMSSGVEFDERYARRTSDIQLFFAKLFALGRGADDVLLDYDRERPSGEVFHYASVDTQALGLMLRRIHGKSLSALLEERIWGPLGMEADALWNVDGEGEDAAEIAFCCLNATLRDFAKLGRLYLRGGDWEGAQLLPEGFTAEATRPSAPHLAPGASPYDYGPRGYQYQWWSPEDPDGEYFAAGVWGQYVYVSEPDGLIVARTSVDPDFRAHMDESIVVFRAIRDTLRSQAAQGEPPRDTE